MELFVSAGDFQDVLMCPSCGKGSSGLYMHHGCVEVYSRREDAPEVRRTCIVGDSLTSEVVPSEGSGNPSRRRDGIRVAFSCEHCHGCFWLNISQHKGQTLMHWTKNSE